MIPTLSIQLPDTRKLKKLDPQMVHDLKRRWLRESGIYYRSKIRERITAMRLRASGALWRSVQYLAGPGWGKVGIYPERAGVSGNPLVGNVRVYAASLEYGWTGRGAVQKGKRLYPLISREGQARIAYWARHTRGITNKSVIKKIILNLASREHAPRPFFGPVVRDPAHVKKVERMGKRLAESMLASLTR
jgi:hypothetical protein